METMDCTGVNVLNFISEECSFVPDNIRQKLEESLQKLIDSLKCDYEQKISSLEKSVLQLQEESNSDRLIDADLKIANLTEEVENLQATCERLENEKQEMQKQMEDAVGKYESLGNMIRNYDLQINNWKEKCTIMSIDFEKLNCDYCDVLDKYMSVKGLEVDYNRRLAESQTEWENSSKEIRRLQAEIDNLRTELTIAKDESKNEKDALISQLSIKTSELTVRQQCIDDLKQKIEKDDKMVEKLSLKLKAEREERIKQVEALEREIQELTKVAHVYKQKIFDDETKLGDVAEGHKELLELIKYGEKKCKNLESELWKSDYNCKRHEENVKKLEKEVDRLNVELAKCKSETVTRSIDELFPMIGAGRQLLKNDISFTEMLRQYSKASDEIFSLKEENMTLRNSIDRIANEIEAKAPYLRQQKEEYSKALQAINEQVKQLDEMKVALANAEKEKTKSESDNRMYEKVVNDLSKQVQNLTGKLEYPRKGIFINNNIVENGGKVGISFNSLEELQSRNVYLLKKIKTMSEKEAELQEEISNLQQTNEIAFIKQQEKYRQLEIAIDDLKDVNNTLRQQLKVYQCLYKKKLDDKFEDIPFAIPESTFGVQTDLTFHDIENLLRDKTSAELFAKELREKLDLIEKERQESLVQLEVSRREVCQVRSANSMLKAELDHAKETFISMNDTKDAFKKQLTLLENQSKEYSNILAEREKEIQALKTAVKVEHDACLRQTDCLHHSQREYMALFEKEKRLRSEYEQLKQCESVLATINASIEVMKVNAEKKNTESHEQLGADMNSAMEECSVLRHLLQDKYKELDKLQLEKDTAVKLQFELEEKFTDELGDAKKEIESQLNEISSLKNSLEEFASQTREFLDEKEKLQEELAARNQDLKDCVMQCEEYQLQLSNLAQELENYKADAERNENTELLKEIAELKEKILQLEDKKSAELVSHEIVEEADNVKSEEEKFESILELEKQMSVDKELSRHSQEEQVIHENTFQSESEQSLVPPKDEYLEQPVQTREVFSNEDTSKTEPSELQWACSDAGVCTVADVQHYSTEMGGMDHSVSVITAAQELRSDIGHRRSSRRKPNFEKKNRILLTIKKSGTATDTGEETFHVNMPSSVVVLDENQPYSTICHTSSEQERDDISQVDQQAEMDYVEHELDEHYDVDQGEQGDSPCSDEARDFTVLQPMPPFEYVPEPQQLELHHDQQKHPEEIDLTDRESPLPVHHIKRKEKQSTVRRRSTPSRPPRGTGTARRSRGTFKAQRKRSSSIDEQPSSSTKMSRRK